MKLINPETNEEYEFSHVMKYDKEDGRGELGTLKHLDTWPKKGDVFYYNDLGSVVSRVYTDVSEYFVSQLKEDDWPIYKDKQEAEAAANRIRSLQEAEDFKVTTYTDADGEKAHFVEFAIPKKYLKAWQSLLEDTE